MDYVIYSLQNFNTIPILHIKKLRHGKVNLSKSIQLSRVTLNIMLFRGALGQFLGALATKAPSQQDNAQTKAGKRCTEGESPERRPVLPLP